MTSIRTCPVLGIPSIETERLVLRGFTADDAEPMAQPRRGMTAQ